MFLREFYEDSDRADRHQWKIIGLIGLALYAFIALAVFAFNNQPTQKEIEQSISKSLILSELDHFCQALPKPQTFAYKYKKLVGNSERAQISYRYKSTSNFSEIRDFYISYFENDGWTQENLWNDDRSALPKYLQYRKGTRTVDLESVNFPDADYSLGCGQDL